MGQNAYSANMRRRIQDFGIAIEGIRNKLDDETDNRIKVELLGRLSDLEVRREQLETKLRDLESQPAGAWTDFKAQFDEEWNTLVQDFEERLGGLE
jgi:DNA-binding transcriptional MerR regulator